MYFTIYIYQRNGPGGRGVPDEHSETDLLVYDFTDKGGTSMYVYFSK